MSMASFHSKHRPLWIAVVSLAALPFAMQAFGLTITTASTVVIFAIATMALNLCVGYTGLVSFGHSTWFGIGAYAAGLIQLNAFPDQIFLPILLIFPLGIFGSCRRRRGCQAPAAQASASSGRLAADRPHGSD